jgi:hypothetical protein
MRVLDRFYDPDRRRFAMPKAFETISDGLGSGPMSATSIG